MSVLRSIPLAVCAFFILPATLWAQAATGSIAGVVRDASGAVLPGVTVEAASPALIEKVRTVVTDAAGAYRIVELRPGTYTVTFTLPGFSTVRREGVELTASFTAHGERGPEGRRVEETITVTGETPVVDISERPAADDRLTRGAGRDPDDQAARSVRVVHSRRDVRQPDLPGCPAARRARAGSSRVHGQRAADDSRATWTG